MHVYRSTAATAILVAILAGTFETTSASAQIPRTLTEFGEPVYPAYEGWYDNPDGSFTLLVGVFNPNQDETIEIPIGENNFISPGPPDQGQPSFFVSGRGHGVFTIRVPADFGDKQVTWTLTSNNQTVTIPMHLQADYYVEPLRDAANGNEPPTIRFSQTEEGHTGPPIGVVHSYTATVGTPLNLSVWTSDVKPADGYRPNPFRTQIPLTLKWHVLRSPGDVEFAEEEQEFEESSDQNPTTTATFSEPGEYLLRVEALDETGEGGSGFQCCWTSAHVRVTVS